MVKLSESSFKLAQKFIETKGRSLEMTRFRHVFVGESGESVFDALRKYQNDDGGFGQALESDIRTSESSAVCTAIAFQNIRATQAKPDERMISSSMTYLLETLDKEVWHWRIIPKIAEESPRAPWWGQAERGDRFDSFSLNPTAEILGYLYDWQAYVPNDIISAVSERVLNYLSELETIEMHDLLCCLRLLQTKSLPKGMGEQIYSVLNPLVDKAVNWQPAQWSTYGLLPLQVVNTPDSLFMAGREEAVAMQLDYEVNAQHGDGSWIPTWSWGDVFPDVWQVARHEWAGVMTLGKLLLLQRFGRIEGL